MSIWTPENGDAGLITPAAGILEKRGGGPRRPPAPQLESLSEPEGPPSRAQRRSWQQQLRRLMRRQRRRNVLAESRLNSYIHKAGKGPRPPIQAVRDPRKWMSADIPDPQAKAA